MYIIHEGFGKICGSSAFLFGVGILAVSESEKRKNGKRCILTQDGIDELKKHDRLKSKEKINKTILADITKLSAETIKKITDQLYRKEAEVEAEAVNLGSLESFFEKLDIKLKEIYYCEAKSSPKKTKIAAKSLSKMSDYQLQCQRLKTTFEELNYEAQRDSFKNEIKQPKRAVFFLIHGKKNYGQKWLVHLLVYKHLPLPTPNVLKHIWKIERKDARNIDKIWRTLAEFFQAKDPVPSNLVDALYQKLQISDVILVLYIEYIDDSCLEDFINNFLRVVVERVNAEPNNKNRLVFFLVDLQKDEARLELPTETNQNNYYSPIPLERIEYFQSDDIKNWASIRCNEEVISKLWKDNNPGFSPQEMVEIGSSNSTNISFFEDICKRCDLTWQDIEKTLAL
ncbi:hypothetical protein [Anabaena sp. CCY 0017]|uniref:hypothetical protein n=1 Tax=Anabaena sp. CCY 0017 TaxID=3103866 RepID=UPI0039C656B6